MGAKIIAVDFDGCLVKNAYPDIGAPNWGVLSQLRKEMETGAKVILWTCRRGDLLFAAVDWCSAQGIMLDAINENLPEIITAFGGDTRKIFANEYWDDRAVRMPCPAQPPIFIQKGDNNLQMTNVGTLTIQR